MLIGMAHPSFLTLGGAEILAARHARYFHEAGHRVRFVTTALDASRWADLTAIAEVRIHGKRWNDHLGVPGTHPKLRRRAVRQASALRGVDVVLAENFPANIVAAHVRGAKRSVWYCNEPSRRLYPLDTNPTLAARVNASTAAGETPLLAFARDQFARHAEALAGNGQLRVERSLDIEGTAHLDRIIGNSCFVAEIIQRVYGRAADAVVYPTVPNVDSPTRRAGALDSAGLRVLTHSRLEPMKNVAMVLLAFQGFASRNPGAHELHVVGEGSDEANLRSLAQTLGLGSAVRFHGFLEQAALEAVYAHCEVMALVPVDEPFGMVYPEAAQRGLLLVGPDHGGPLEILDGGTLGWVVDIFSPDALAEAFDEAWRLPSQEVDRLRERAAKACRSRYSPQATLPTLLAQLVD